MILTLILRKETNGVLWIIKTINTEDEVCNSQKLGSRYIKKRGKMKLRG